MTTLFSLLKEILFKLKQKNDFKQKVINQNINNHKTHKMKTKVLFVILVFNSFLIACNNSNNNPNNGNTYQEKVMSVEEIERTTPTKFLSAEGTYKPNFWGNKINGSIKNIATVATYKDVVIKVTYYSKTKTELGSSNYTVYDFFLPQSEKPFELKIDNYKDVNSVGCEVISALIK